MSDIQNSAVICKEVIITTVIENRGTGSSPLDKCRNVMQIWDKDGTLIMENDPADNKFTTQDMIDFAKWVKEEGWKQEYINEEALKEYLEKK